MTDEVEEYDFHMLSSMPQVEHYWPGMEPLLQSYIDRAAHGEMDVNDIFNQIADGKAISFVVAADTAEGPKVRLAIVTEVVQYPKLNVLNIVAIGGDHLDLFKAKFWNAFTGWAYMIGVRAIEGSVGEAVGRMIAKYGFTKMTTLMRYDLTGE